MEYPEVNNELIELIQRKLDGVLDDEQFNKLQRILEDNPSAVDYYVKTMLAISELRMDGAFENKPCRESSAQASFADSSVWQALAEDEKKAPAIQMEKPTEKSVESWQGLMKVEKPKRTISRLSVYTLILSAAAMLFLMILVLSSPIRPIVATLTDSINAEWISEDEIPAKWDVLKQGELTLVRGLAEITFHDGAVVVVEGPAVIELESPKSMFVASGKISAVVSEYATGFTVNTLSASIVDLGTEFGVSVEDNGSCSLHMFKGTASLIAGKKGKVRTSQIVNGNEARSIDEVTGVVKEVKLSDKSFVRHINSQSGLVWRGESMDLTDIVCGGNGFGTGVLGTGIDPTSGEVTSKISYISDRPGTTKFSVVEEQGYIDGVFVPGKAQIISSAGDIWQDSPETKGTFWCAITNCRIKGDGLYSAYPSMLDNRLYGTVANPGLMMHPNAGITFDLDAIRKDNPGICIRSLSALCGITEFCAKDRSYSDIWVLIDGEVRYHYSHRDLDKTGQGQPIDIKILQADRFLTLATTDGGDKIYQDWCLFGRPMLEIELCETNVRASEY